MSKNSANAMIMIACLLLAGASWADSGKVGAAASNPRRIGELVAAMEAAEVAPFAGQVIEAVSQMPLSPSVRIRQMGEVAARFMDAAPAGGAPALLAAMLPSVPPHMLPGLVRSLKPRVDLEVAELSDGELEKVIADTLGAIAANEEIDDESKAACSAFAVALLWRPPAVEGEAAQEELLGRLMAGLPEGYRDHVAAATPAALQGDYSLLLGPAAERFVESYGKIGPRSMLAHTEYDTHADRDTHDVNRPAPISRLLVVGEEPSTSSSTAPSVSSSPVIPPPYAGQF